MDREKEQPLQIGDYELVKPLGMGAFGKVKLGIHKKTGVKVAIKVMAKKRIKETKMSEKVHREINCQKRLSHPHVVRMYEVIDTPTHIFVVLEYCPGGELFDYIVSRGRLSIEDARRMFQQVVCALEYVHHHQVVHRDLKPENVLLDERQNIKIADFGLCNTMKDGDFIKTSCGSPNYAAPEVISNHLYAGPEVDVWSAGVIFYALLCGSLPFDDDNIPNLFRKIKSGFFYMPSHLSNMAKDLLSRMLTVDPLKRITIAEIRQHPWFQARLPPYLNLRPPEVDEKYTEVEEGLLRQVAGLGWGHLAGGEAVAPAAVRRAVLSGGKAQRRRRARGGPLEAGLLGSGPLPGAPGAGTAAARLQRALEVAYFVLREQQRQRTVWEDLARHQRSADSTPPAFTPHSGNSHASSLDGSARSTHRGGGPPGGGGGAGGQGWMQEAQARQLVEATEKAFGVGVPPPPASSLAFGSSPYAVARPAAAATPPPPPAAGVAQGQVAPPHKRRRWFLGIQSKKDPIHIMMELFRILYMLGCRWRKVTKNAGYRLHVCWRPNAPRPPQAAYIAFPAFCEAEPPPSVRRAAAARKPAPKEEVGLALEDEEEGDAGSDGGSDASGQGGGAGRDNEERDVQPGGGGGAAGGGGGGAPPPPPRRTDSGFALANGWTPQYFSEDYEMKFGLALYKLDAGLYLLDFWLMEGQAFFFMQLCATVIMNLKKGSARVQRAKLAEEGLLPNLTLHGQPQGHNPHPTLDPSIPQVQL